MTTVAFRDGILAFDSLVTSGEGVSGYIIKGVKTKKYIAAAAGSAEDASAFLDWVKSDFDEDEKIELGLDRLTTFSAIVIDKKGKVFSFEEKLLSFEAKAKFYAIGSGDEFALGAMAFGASAKEALQIAKKLDTKTGGRIRTLSFN